MITARRLLTVAVVLTILLGFHFYPTHSRQYKEDMERQKEIDNWFLEHWGEVKGGGIDQWVQDTQARQRMSNLDRLIVSNEGEMLDRELCEKEHDKMEKQTKEALAKQVPVEEEPQVMVLTAADGNVDQQILDMALHNREEYTERHGYLHQYVQLDESSKLHPSWQKIDTIKRTFDRYPDVEWVWWLDVDAIIMNQKVKLGQHLLDRKVLQTRLAYGHPLRNTTAKFEGQFYPKNVDGDVDLVISQDSLGINAGSFFVRRSSFTDMLLEMWGDQRAVQKSWERNEQDALIHLLLTHPVLLQNVGLVPQRVFNAYHDSSRSHTWRYRTGDFVVHFAGKSNEKKFKSLWNEYWNDRLYSSSLSASSSA